MEIERKGRENRAFSFKITMGDVTFEIGIHHPWVLVHVRCPTPLDETPSEELNLFCSHCITKA